MKTHLILIMVLVFLTGFLSAQDNKASVQLTAAIYEEEVTGNLDKAIRLYLDILKNYPENRQVASKTLYHLGLVNEKMGQQKAVEYFTRLVNTYPDQTEMVTLAKARLAAFGGSSGTERTEIAMRRIWDAGKDIPYGISPDGRYVVFLSSNISDLWLRDLQTGEQKRVTREASEAGWTFATGTAVISPDIKQIAYCWQVSGLFELRLSALDGSSRQVLQSSQDGRIMYPSAWMPDGHRILAVSYNLKDSTYQRHIISLPDDTIYEIGLPETENLDWGYPSPENLDWGYPSPDGLNIAYDLKGNIFTYNITTERDLVLVQNPATDHMVGWTPDGSGILFWSDRSGTDGLYLLTIGNGKPRGEPELLRQNLGTKASFYMARDGRLFRFENTGTSDSFIVTIDEHTGKLSGTPSLVDSNYPGVSNPAWSPDGALLYYAMIKGSYGDRSKVLVIRSEATGETREITPKGIMNWINPILSPDGRQFAVTGTGENHSFGVFAIDSESGDVSQLAKIPSAKLFPNQNWSPDGKAIFYEVWSLSKKGEFAIRRKDLITGEEKDIYSGIHPRDMKISPDGTRFAYYTNDKPTKSYILGILDIQSGKAIELWHLPEADSPGISTPSWTPDGKYVLVAKEVKQGSELWRFPAVGGPGEKLYSSPEKCWGFILHPSGKRMAFMQSRSNYEVWVLENFLPKDKTVGKQK